MLRAFSVLLFQKMHYSCSLLTEVDIKKHKTYNKNCDQGYILVFWNKHLPTDVDCSDGDAVGGG